MLSPAPLSPDLPTPPLPERRFVPRADGGEVAYVEAGSGPPVVLIHGALTHADDMRIGLFDRLSPERRVIAFDRPGHGWSTRERLRDASPWRQAAVLREAAQALGAERPVLVGHSFGGAVALAWGMAHPDEVAGVVALAPIVWPEPRLELMLFGPRSAPGAGDAVNWTADAGADRAALPLLWRAMFLPQPMPERFADEFDFARAGDLVTKRSTGEDAVAIVTDLWRSAAAYPGCRAPVRVLAGDADAVINPALHARALAGVLPDAWFRSLPGMGHMLHHFAADEVAEAVESLGG